MAVQKQSPHEVEAARQGRHPMNREAFDRLIQFHEQVKRNHQGQIFEDSTEIIRQMREERSEYWGVIR